MRPPLSADEERLLTELAARSPSDRVPLFLELARRQSARRRPADLLMQFERDAFVRASDADQRTVVRFDAAALEAAEGFEAVLLSPLAPLGTCSVVSPTTQDRSITTTRNTEVVSDPTNVLALACARRLLAGERHVRLCTVHQVVRPQRFPAKAGWSQHFRLFAMAEAGPSRASHGFEVEAVVGHAAVPVRFFRACEQLGCRFPGLRAVLHVAPDAEVLGGRIRERLTAELPALPVVVETLRSGYYQGIRLLIGAERPTAEGTYCELADVGVFDWAGTLTSDRRMRFVASGLGIQLVPLLFRV